MARIDKRALTRLEIIQVATKSFLEIGYTNTSVKVVCKELGMSPGNVTFYFPTKEHLLVELVKLLCGFQARSLKEEDPLFSLCMETAMLAAMCEYNEIAKDVFISAYTSPLCLDFIRKNDTDRAEVIFKNYRPNWTEAKFAEAELLASGIEYAIMMNAGDPLSLNVRIESGIENILSIFGVPEDVRKSYIKKVGETDLLEASRKAYELFKEFAETENGNSLQKIFNIS